MLRVEAADGTWRHLATWARDHRDDPIIAGIVVTSRDVTEQVIAQERVQLLSRVLETSQEIVTLCDPSGRVLYANAIARKEYGVHEGAAPLEFAKSLFPHEDEQLESDVLPTLQRGRRVGRRDDAEEPGRPRGAGGGDPAGAPPPGQRRTDRLDDRARHQRAEVDPGPARAPGHPRSAHRPAQPAAVPGARRAGPRAERPLRHDGGGAVPRPRPLQAGERLVRPHSRRRAARAGRRPAPQLRASWRRRRPLRRRRVRRALRAPRRAGGDARARAPAHRREPGQARGDQWHVGAGRRRASASRSAAAAGSRSTT